MTIQLARDYFDQAVRALGGQRVPLDDESSKMLRFMLARPEGCDLSLRPDRLEIRFGWHPARHRYDISTAPPIVSYFADQAEARGIAGVVCAVIGPSTVCVNGFPAWSHEERRVWLGYADDKISILVRDAQQCSSEEAPKPIDFPAPAFVELEAPVECPTCRTGATHFRECGGGALLVCGNCGGSFAK